ncbi:MAG: trigger factor [Calditrichia bacterium]
MQVTVETVNSYTKKIQVILEPDDLLPVERKVMKDFQKEVQIPGFRRGKAPLNMIKKQYTGQIRQEIIEEALNRYFYQAMDQSDLKPVGQGKIVDFDFKDLDSGMTFTIEVEVEPEFELKKYKGLKVEKEIYQVTEEMVEQNLEYLREQYATVKEVEQAQENDYIFFDAQELGEGDVPIVGHRYSDLEMQLGSGKFDPEIEQQLIGIKTDEKRIVEKIIPPNMNEGQEKATRNRLEIHVKRIEKREFPELNDEFVKNLDDEDLENLDQLRERIRENLKAQLEHRSNENFENRLVDELLKENPFDVPPGMVDHYLDEMEKDYFQQAKDSKISQEDFRKKFRPTAIHHIRWYLLRKAIKEAENIEVSAEEVNQFIQNLPMDEKDKERAKRSQGYLNHLREDLLDRKIMDFLKSHAEVIEIYPKEKPVIEA